jgi:hypothetical protein
MSLDNSIYKDITSSFHQINIYITKGFQSVSNYYLKHQEEIDKILPLALKISLYGIIISTCFSAPLITFGVAVIGYALANRVSKICCMMRESYQSMMDSKQYSPEDKMVLKVLLISGTIAAGLYFSAPLVAIPVGTSIGYFLRAHLI